MRIIHIPDIFLVQQGCIKQIYLGSLQQYRIRRNVLIRYHCISDKYTRKSAGHFPWGHKIMWNLMCVTYLWIHRLIDRLMEWVSEWMSEQLMMSAVWLSLKSNSFYTLLRNNLSKPWHMVTRYSLSLYQSWFIIEWQGVSFFKEKLTKDISLKSNRSSKNWQRLLNGGYVKICFLGDLQIVNRSK